MREFIFASATVGCLLLSASAWANYIDVTYSGTVEQVAASGVPAGITIGTPIAFSAVFDTAKLVDNTAVVNGFVGNLFSSVLNASLSDDPLASLTITIGPVTFTKFDQAYYGTPCSSDLGPNCVAPGLGAGNLPAATYLNGSFAGVSNIFANSQGYTLDADPIADAVLRAHRGRAFRVMSPGDYDFILSTGTEANAFEVGLAAGDIDIADAKFSPVPEPSTWTLLLGLIPLLGLHRLRFGA